MAKFFRLTVMPASINFMSRTENRADHRGGMLGPQPTPEDKRLELRRQYIAPQLEALKTWMRAERARLSRHNEVAKAMDYMLNRWAAFTRFLSNGKICLTNNAAERALRCIAVGRKNWRFCGSDRGGDRAAAIYTLIGAARLNDVAPQAWLADVLGRICDLPVSRLHELLLWNWRKPATEIGQAV